MNYKKPDQQNIKNLYMHLTNYSLNKNSSRFVLPEGKTLLCRWTPRLTLASVDEFYNESTASKRLLTNIYKSLMQKGIDIRHLKRQI